MYNFPYDVKEDDEDTITGNSELRVSKSRWYPNSESSILPDELATQSVRLKKEQLRKEEEKVCLTSVWPILTRHPSHPRSNSGFNGKSARSAKSYSQRKNPSGSFCCSHIVCSVPTEPCISLHEFGMSSCCPRQHGRLLSCAYPIPCRGLNFNLHAPFLLRLLLGCLISTFRLIISHLSARYGLSRSVPYTGMPLSSSCQLSLCTPPPEALTAGRFRSNRCDTYPAERTMYACILREVLWKGRVSNRHSLPATSNFSLLRTRVPHSGRLIHFRSLWERLNLVELYDGVNVITFAFGSSSILLKLVSFVVE